MKIKVIILFLLALIGSAAHASIPPPITIGTAQVVAIGNFTVPSSDVVTLKAQIVSCGQGQLPLYNGVPVSLTPNQSPASPFLAANTGSVQSLTFTVPGNDKLICGGQSYTTYALTWYDNGFPLAPTQTYRFADGGTQTLSNLVPISFIPPVLTNAAGALCPVNTPLFIGFDQNYKIQCAAAVSGLTAALPINGGTLLGNLNIPLPGVANINTIISTNTTTKFINLIPQADQFPGGDFCIQLRNAEVFALNNNINLVDATHYQNAVNCSVDPFVNLALDGHTDTVQLEVMLPASIISFTTPIQVNDTGIKLRGAGRGNTIWLYAGAAVATNLFTIGGDAANFTQLVEVHDMSFVDSHTSGSSNNDLQIFNSHRDVIENVSAWGGHTCFITAGAVTDTLSNLHCSNEDAAQFQWNGYQTPTAGIFMTSQGGNDTTDGTVRDISVEFVTGIGIELSHADNMVFTAGTSEGNLRGIKVDNNAATNKWNTFISMDIEGNSLNAAGVDVQDEGQGNFYINGLYTSPCSGCHSVTAGGGGGQFLLGDGATPTGFSGSWNVLSNNPDFSNNGGTFKMLVASITTANVTQVNSGDIEGSGVFKGPILTSNGSLPTCAVGTGVTTCAVAAGSTQSRGFITITNASATTTQVLGTLNFASSLAGAPFCSLEQSGGVAYYGLFSNSTTAAHFTIVNTQTVSGVTSITLSYFCQL